MNKERKVSLTIVINLLAASAKLSPRQSRAMEKGIEQLLDSEERAQRAMEPYKDVPTTAANYRNTTASITHLRAALADLVEGDLPAAVDHLEGALDPGARQVQRGTSRRTHK